ncbi:hypothetical protein [Hyphomicrobium sp. CS1GBMeth3]|uniref:hypothetical protein n=1 Tax=Hyphomicrobium sp. CS1GBMeth3 TaxID=1892845 RepID=UPI000930759C|nr:hypothetical protein [Hyphomicrobium sp. CS1GBMeth3]
MQTEDPKTRPRPENAGPEETAHERRSIMRVAAVGAITLLVFLVGYFVAFGPLEEHESAYPPAGRNLELERKAAPHPQPNTP